MITHIRVAKRGVMGISLVLLALAGPLVLTTPSARAQAPGPAPAQLTRARPVPPNDPRRGLIYDGLRSGAPGGRCAGGFEYDVQTAGGPVQVRCTHGPDPIPPDAVGRGDTQPLSAQALSAPLAAPSLPCIGNGSDGFRVQVMYVRSSDVADRFNQFLASFQEWVREADEKINASAAETGSSQHVRWVTDGACNPVVTTATLTPAGDDNMDNTVQEMANQGFTQSNRKYMLFVDAAVICGQGDIYVDDSPGQGNPNNGIAEIPAMMSRVDTTDGCWNSHTVAHEVFHNMGGVQPTAPHKSAEYHCTDESDMMCYDDDDDGPVVMQQICPLTHEDRLDCNHDDYYHTNPPAGNWLATHWNTANNVFLTPATPLSSGLKPPADFDGNGTTDVSVFRPSTGQWYVRNGVTVAHGANGDLSVPGDYDGNGTTDIAVFRPSSGTWYVRNGITAAWGTNGDIPVPGDYDGNGTTDIAVFRPSAGVWYVRNGISAGWGTSGDIPVPGDYDGNGTTDVAIFRPSSGTWFVRNGITAVWGTTGDIPVPGDYDGNATADVAVFRPSAGVWYVRNGISAGWGTSGDVPVPGDYDGNGNTDIAVFRPSNGLWFVRNGVSVGWGASGDHAVPLSSAIRQFFF